MRGKVLAVAGAGAPGAISGEDGRRYRYGLPDLRSTAPQPGQEVDFAAAGEDAREIYLVPGSQPAVFSQVPNRDWVAFYLSPSGRVARADYWLFGFLVILGANILIGWIPLIGQLFSLATTWCGIALAIKRCHDVGRSGWWSAVTVPPFALMIVGAIVLAISNGGGVGITLLSLGGIATFGAALWLIIAVLARRGDPGPNRFGPAPEATNL